LISNTPDLSSWAHEQLTLIALLKNPRCCKRDADRDIVKQLENGASLVHEVTGVAL
jgi:hypothetical protein